MAGLIYWNGNLPSEISESVKELGRKWNALRPRFDPHIERAWDNLIDKWAESLDIPLIIRKSSGIRGSELTHITGRSIILSDNSPAQWVCYLALDGQVPTIDEIKDNLLNDRIPISFATKKSEKDQIKYKHTLGKYSINKFGWKLCHKIPVGVNTTTELSTVDMNEIISKFKNLMKPSNFFLIPIKLGGLGELQEFIDEIR